VSGPEKFQVLVTDKVSASGLAPLLEDERFDVFRIDDTSTPEFREALSVAQGLVVRSATTVTAELLAGAPALRVVGRAGVGVDNIDLEAATERGIAVMNAPAGNTVSAAELTMALILAVVRQVPAADASVRAGKWERSRFKGIELRGKTLGLVGAGRIGGEVAVRCMAFGMKVLAYDPYLTDEGARALRIERGSLDDVLAEADVISLHVPLTDDTRGLIGADALRRMKKSTFLVNVARGGVVDEAALAAALQEGVIAGAALDVYAAEPLDEDSPLLEAPNLVLTPHLGASTSEAQELVSQEISAAVRAALAEGDLSRALNAPAVSGDVLRALGPLLDLGRRMGRLACAIVPGGAREVEVRYAGASDEGQSPLTRYVVMGLLENVLGEEHVNFVNAAHLARGRGIGVSSTRSARRADYTEYLEVVVKAEKGEVTLAGALLGDTHPRIVRVNDFHIDVVPAGTLLVLKNRDVPGVIGRVGTLLGARGVNIAEYHQARQDRGGDALAAVAVDGGIDAALRSELLELPEVLSAVVVRLD